MSVIEFRTLGTLDLRAADGRELYSLLAQSKRIALLAYLCVAQPRGFHRRDKLLGLFWPDADHEHARTSLRKSLHILRQSLGEDAVVSRGDEDVSVNFERISCDAVTFEENLRAERYEEAVELYRGDLLPGFFVDEAPEFEQWLTSERARLRSSAARAALFIARKFETLANLAAAVTWTRRSLELSDNDELALRKLIELQNRAGDRGGAIQSYEAFAGQLASEYRTEPSGETRSLIERIRSGDESSLEQIRSLRDPTAKELQAAQIRLRDDDGPGLPERSSLKTHGRTNRRRADRIMMFGGITILMVSLGFVWASRRTPSSTQVLRYTLAIDSSEALAAAIPWSGRVSISPNGQLLAYIGGPRNRLLVRPRNELHARAIAGSENASTPFFSPDGSSIGFLGENQIRIVSLAANKIVNVSDSLNGVAGASWGPDGFIYADGARESPLIRVRAAPGSAVAWFTALDTVNGEIDHTWPEVLPNGKGVLFTVTFSGKNKPGGRASVAIAVAEIPSGAHRIIVEGGVYPRYAEPRRLLYVTPSGVLMLVPFDQTTMTVTGPPTALTTGMRVGRFGSADLAISAKGTLVYSSGAERSQQNLVWKSRNGSEAPATPDWPPGVLLDPALSPDGKSVAVSRSLDGRIGEIWIRDVSRGTSLKLTNGGVYNRAPTWTPDGLSITFIESVLNGNLLRTVRADGSGEPRVLLRSKRMLFGPRWSPDAKWLLAFTDWESSGGADVIGVRPGVDSITETFLATKANESEIAISRNGRWLAYDCNESGRDEIYVVPFPKTSSAKWVITSGGGHSALWSHSGKELFYRDLAGDVYSVAVNTTANFSAGARKRLFSAPEEEFSRYQGYDVTPDDQRFLMVKQVAKEQPDKLIVVENWFEELKTRAEKPPY